MILRQSWVHRFERSNGQYWVTVWLLEMEVGKPSGVTDAC